MGVDRGQENRCQFARSFKCAPVESPHPLERLSMNLQLLGIQLYEVPRLKAELHNVPIVGNHVERSLQPGFNH